MHVLDIERMEWFVPLTTGTAPSARNNHATFVVGSRLFIHGGHDGNRWLADMYVLDTERWEWSIPEVAGTPPSPRACHTTSMVGRKVFLFGGYDGTRCFNDLDVLDIDTMTWIQPRVLGTLPPARNAQTVTVVGSRLFLFGGHSGQKHLRDLHVFDTLTMTWSQPEATGQLPPGLRGHTASLIGSKIYLFGGYDGRGRSNDLFLLDTASFAWEHPASTDATPGGRQRHTACLLNSKRLLVFGGFDGFKWLSDCYVLDVSRLEATAITSATVVELLRDLRTLVNNESAFPDVVFLVEGRRVFGHRAILSARSPRFRALLGSGMRESFEREITISDWSYAPFVMMLEYLYTGSVADLALSAAVELMTLADHNALDGLKALCETTLVNGMDADNVCALLITAHRSAARELKRQCIEYIMKHNAEVSLEPLSVEPTVLMEVARESLRLRDPA